MTSLGRFRQFELVLVSCLLAILAPSGSG